MGDKTLNAYTFTKMQGHNFSLFPNDELLNSTVVETNRYARHISELQLSPRSIWSRWSDVSIPEMKAF
jgi:hypothetical protein